MKKPWLAALLNVIPGVGYLYLNIKRVFAWMILASLLASVLDSFDPALANYDPGPTTPWFVLSVILLWGAFVVDGYFEAVRANAKK
jgi:hypothetical protein